jgi:hypothetical protein
VYQSAPVRDYPEPANNRIDELANTLGERQGAGVAALCTGLPLQGRLFRLRRPCRRGPRMLFGALGC